MLILSTTKTTSEKDIEATIWGKTHAKKKQE